MFGVKSFLFKIEPKILGVSDGQTQLIIETASLCIKLDSSNSFIDIYRQYSIHIKMRKLSYGNKHSKNKFCGLAVYPSRNRSIPGY